MAELPEQWDMLWFIQDRLLVIVPLDEPVAPGRRSTSRCIVELRLPYMQIAPMTYVTNHAANRRTLAVR